MNLAILYRKKEDYLNSINIYNLLLQKYPNYIPGKYNLALVYKFNKDTANSLREFQEILQTEPDNIKAIKQIAYIYTNQKKYSAALNVLNDAVNIDNSDHKLREPGHNPGTRIKALQFRIPAHSPDSDKPVDPHAGEEFGSEYHWANHGVSRFYFFHSSHIGMKRIRDKNTAIGLLQIFENCRQASADSKPRPV